VAGASADEASAHVVVSPVGIAAVVVNSADTTTSGVIIAHNAAVPDPVGHEAPSGVVSPRCVADGAEGHAISPAVRTGFAEVRLSDRAADGDERNKSKNKLLHVSVLLSTGGIASVTPTTAEGCFAKQRSTHANVVMNFPSESGGEEDEQL